MQELKDTLLVVSLPNNVKIKSLQQRLSERGITTYKDSDVSFALNTTYSKGDNEKAYELLALVADSEQGIILPYRTDVNLLGAVNRESVTCWLDSLLFAMFARLGSFEAMLQQNLEKQAEKKLATLLRLWINTLRSGKLVTVDIVGCVNSSPNVQVLKSSYRRSRYSCNLPTAAGKTLQHCANMMHQKPLRSLPERWRYPCSRLKWISSTLAKRIRKMTINTSMSAY